MSRRLVVLSLLLAIAIAPGPALACKGSILVFADDFKVADPAWQSIDDDGKLTIAAGKLQVTTAPGNGALVQYSGFFMDSGDACVDMVAPEVKDPQKILGGILFGLTQTSFFGFVLRADGFAAVIRKEDGGWLFPVQMKKAGGAKPGANVSNTLRVTWKDAAAQTYINDQPFATIRIIRPIRNGKVGVYAEPEGETYQFTNFKVTDTP
jgi:hypothetical protein